MIYQEGEVYVPVEANSTRGISTLDLVYSSVKPEDEEGAVNAVVWLLWRYQFDAMGEETGAQGYIGQGWYWDVSLAGIKSGWEKVASELGYLSTYEGFTKWLFTAKPTNLDNLLADWNRSQDKLDFLDIYTVTLKNAGCLTYVYM